MKNIRKIALILVLVTLSGCRDQVTEPDAPVARKWGAATNGIRCSIALPSPKYVAGDPIPVSIWIENITLEPIELEAVVAFQLYDADNLLQYSAVFDLMASQPDSTRSRRTQLVLSRLQRLEWEVDLIQLGWTHITSSRPPDQTFFDLIGRGQFSLRLAIEIIPTKTESFNYKWIFSNDVPLQIN